MKTLNCLTAFFLIGLSLVLSGVIKAGVPVAEDSPPRMCRIPAGSFRMGDPYAEGLPNERPVHTVTVGEFYLDKYEVSKALWDEIHRWAIGRGYQFDHAGSGQGPDHPVYDVNWYDAVKWCNARSEKQGLTPTYYTDAAQTTLYRSGRVDLAVDRVKWSANGYRLPTEAEWEKAARGGLEGHHFPWPSLGGSCDKFVDGSKGNYLNSGDPFESNTIMTTPVGYYNGSQKPAGGDMANGYGLYDMDGNQWEWCWDWYSGAWYSEAGATQSDTRGPASGELRVLRGGGWDDGPGQMRCAWRFRGLAPTGVDGDGGFRCARGH